MSLDPSIFLIEIILSKTGIRRHWVAKWYTKILNVHLSISEHA